MNRVQIEMLSVVATEKTRSPLEVEQRQDANIALSDRDEAEDAREKLP